MYTDNSNLAYDLSRFDNSARQQRDEERKKEAEARKMRLAPLASPAKSGKILGAVVIILLIFGALYAVNYVNAKKDDSYRELTKGQELYQSVLDDNALLQSKLDAKVNIGFIEEYAVNTLKMTKIGSSQKKYVPMNTQSLIEIENDDSEGFWGSLKKSFDSFLEYMGL